MGRLHDEMLRDMELKGLTDQTKKTYIRVGKRLARFHRRSPTEMVAADVRAFLDHLRKSGYSRASLNVYHAGLCFLFGVTLGKPSVMAGIPRAKVPKTKPRILKGTEVARVIAAMPSLRHRAICMTTYSAGLRISETCALHVTDIDSTRGRMLIRRAKGQKDRYVPLSRVLLDTLREYWRAYRPAGPHLFPGRYGDRPITTAAFKLVMRRVSEELGLTPNVTAHHLRHAFATHMLEFGTDLRVLQLLLGHADPKSTEHYITISERVLGRLENPLDLLGTPDGRILG